VIFWTDLGLSLAVAGFLTLAFWAGFRRQGPLTYLPVVFVVVFLATWAGGAWIQPAALRPGWRWLPFAAVGLIFALLLVAAAPRQPRSRARVAEEAVDEAVTFLGFRRVLWFLLFLLALFILLRYATP
jgi:hypothetical protein